ncbi:UPF0577 protein-like protein [Aphelenchoides besseyi]|nr:UPF0577 protein-like protein [Aphelenchoides besseyi]KAI6221269.1 UPF0577 protein-like protein [Aphelenchoides besseyi]
MIRTIVFLVFVRLSLMVNGRQCAEEDLEYQYTECDTNGERWLVSLPRSHAQPCDNVPAPRPGVNCSFTCAGGHYLDMKTQECRTCSAGTYSLGDGVRYESFKELPSGFWVENFVDDSQQFYSAFGNGPSVSTACPKGAGWLVQSGEIRYNPTSCNSRLSISLNLVRDGHVELFYQMPKNSRRGLVSDLVIRNEQCESYNNQAASIFSRRKSSNEEEVSTGNDWHLRRFSVHRGRNLLIWTVSSNNEFTTLADIIRISKIDIVGLAFTPACSFCSAGTYSGSGATNCLGCQTNTFSEKGSKTCTQCQINEYSGPKSGVCHRKPICQNYDFYPSYGPCSAGKTTQTFHRVTPTICQPDSDSSVGHPDNQQDACRSCSPGSHRNPTTGVCEICSKDEYSADGKGCQKCPNNTIPNYGLFYSNWEQMPTAMSTNCEYLVSDDAEKCPAELSWIPLGNRIETAPTRARGFALELIMNISTGFYDPLRTEGTPISTDYPIAMLSLDLEIQCSDSSCQLYIMIAANGEKENDNFGLYQFLGAFSGSVKRERFVYPIEQSMASRIIFAFVRSGAVLSQDHVTDRAAIYGLNLTNVGDAKTKTSVGGADSCRPCPNSGATNKCVPCLPGYYVEESTNRCMKCPENTMLNRTSGHSGIASCTKCPPHMGSESRTDCSFGGKLMLKGENNKTLNFDLTPLSNLTLKADGLKVFPREGSAYFHSFNVSIFGRPVTCRDNYDNSVFNNMISIADSGKQPTQSNARFCRATAMPLTQLNGNGRNSTTKIAYMSAYAISSRLASITQERTFGKFLLSDKQLEYDVTTSTNRPIDVHFFFEPTARKVGACANGTVGVVTVRCDPLATKSADVRLSRSCPDGTCDGCLFHVIVESRFGCPICDAADFDEIRGECLDGYQKIHSIPSKHCVLSGAQTRERTESCTSGVSTDIRLFFFLAILVIAFLLIVIVVIYQRNKTLEYRYSRIIEGKEPDEFNSCGLESDEDEEDVNQTKVFFNKNRNGNEHSAKVTVGKNRTKERSLNSHENADFLSDSSD